jgi:hypothetical protein
LNLILYDRHSLFLSHVSEDPFASVTQLQTLTQPCFHPAYHPVKALSEVLMLAIKRMVLVMLWVLVLAIQRMVAFGLVKLPL